jgi:RNA polymerase sigma-70 factor (ECF subfamily)
MIVMQTLVDLHRRHLGAKMRDGGREVAIEDIAYPEATSASMAIILVGHLTSPSQAAARAERVAVVRQAIETMDPVDREVLALRHFEELTNQETAEVLRIQPKAASIRYVRALRRLKAILTGLPDFHDETRDA